MPRYCVCLFWRVLNMNILFAILELLIQFRNILNHVEKEGKEEQNQKGIILK